METAISELERRDGRKVLQILQHGLGLVYVYLSPTSPPSQRSPTTSSALDNQTQPGPARPPIALPEYVTGVHQVFHQTPLSSQYTGPTSSNSAPTMQSNVPLNEPMLTEELYEQLLQIYVDMEKY